MSIKQKTLTLLNGVKFIRMVINLTTLYSRNIFYIMQQIQQNPSNTKSDILIIARELIQKDGVEKISMRKIANKLGLTATSIYYHYKNKEEIIAELVKESRLRLSSYISNRLRNINDPVQIILEGFKSYIDYGIENPEEYKIMFMLPYPSNVSSKLKENVADKTEPSITEISKMIVEVNSNLKEVSEHVAHSLWLMVHGYVSVFVSSREDIIFDKNKVYMQLIEIVNKTITSNYE